MRQPRERKITIECSACAHVFGVWRDRCPACGTEMTWQEKARYAPPPTPARKQREVKSPCIVCRQRGAKKRCPHCDEMVHGVCLALHANDCAEFQVRIEEELERLEEPDAHGEGDKRPTPGA